MERHLGGRPHMRENRDNPDLFIRTGGDKRLSGFLLWEMAYTELYFSEILWPDFSEEEFKKAVNEFTKRERKFGQINE